jgi:hypothetical protein
MAVYHAVWLIGLWPIRREFGNGGRLEAAEFDGEVDDSSKSGGAEEYLQDLSALTLI